MDYYTNKIKNYIGAYSALLNGLDLLIFTGAVGENSHEVRSMACNEMEYLGLLLDSEKNFKNLFGFIHNEKSKVQVLVIETNEVGQMFEELLKLVK